MRTRFATAIAASIAWLFAAVVLLLPTPARADCARPPPLAPLLEATAQRFASNDVLATGALGDTAVKSAVASLCAPGSFDPKPLFPRACGELAAPALISLRDAVVRDLADLPLRYAPTMAADPPREALALQVALLAIEAATHGDDPQALVLRLRTGIPRLDGTCGVEIPSAAQSDLVVASAIVARIAAIGDAPTAAAAAQDELKRATRIPPNTPLEPAREEAAQRVQRALAVLRSLPPDAMLRRAETTAEIVTNALVIVDGDASLKIPPEALAFISALAHGELGAAAIALAPLAARRVVVPPDIAAVVQKVERVLRAKNPDDVKDLLKNLILGPWAEPWMFDVSGLAIRATSSETKIGGDFLLGYSGRGGGVALRGGIGYYDFTQGPVQSDTSRLAGGLDGWGVFGSKTVKGELRGHGEVALHDSNLIDRTNPTALTFSEETSLFLRFAGLLGLRLEPSDRFAFGAWVGPGFSYESYDPLRVARAGLAPQVSLSSNETVSFLLEGRLRAQWIMIPSWVAVRGSTDFQRFSLTRDSLAITASAGNVTSTQTAASAEQIELRSRLFLDAEVARFAGFVPGLTGGIDLIERSGAESLSAVVPVFGAGIRRTSF